MNELIAISTNDNQEPIISGRELHQKLGVDSKYQDWIKRMLDYGFSENVDFTIINELSQKKEGSRYVTRNLENHILKLDMAKEICMLQRNEKGKMFRQYFIEVEKEFNSPEKIMARALMIADKKIHNLELTIEEQRPKVLFANAVETSNTSILIGDFAKILKQNGVNIGQNKLFAWLRENGYLISRKGDSFNMPTQRSMQMKLFEIKERTHNNPDGSVIISKTTKMTGKAQVYFMNKFLKM